MGVGAHKKPIVEQLSNNVIAEFAWAEWELPLVV